MKAIISYGIIASLFLFSCNSIAVDSKTQNAQVTNEASVSQIVNEVHEDNKDPVVASFDFVKNIESDNFYEKDQTDKRMTISNLIVIDYYINSENEVKLSCIAYSPDLNKIIPFVTDLDGDKLLCIIGNDTASERIGGRNEYYKFTINLENPKQVKQLSFYDGSDNDRCIKGYYHTNEPAQNNDQTIIRLVENIISVRGVFKGSDNELIFDQCSFEITKSFTPKEIIIKGKPLTYVKNYF